MFVLGRRWGSGAAQQSADLRGSWSLFYSVLLCLCSSLMNTDVLDRGRCVSPGRVCALCCFSLRSCAAFIRTLYMHHCSCFVFHSSTRCVGLGSFVNVELQRASSGRTSKAFDHSDEQEDVWHCKDTSLVVGTTFPQQTTSFAMDDL